ncbi:MAG: formylmethanofuran dehydrogenase subunit C [Gemmataceae bacterium]
MITLTLKQELPNVPLEAENLSPDVTASLDHAGVCGLPLYLGKKQVRVDEFFDVDGAASDELEIRGDGARIKWIGKGMTTGRIKIVGNAGMHLGAYMKGGAIEVTGNASDWVGGEMTGGLIRIAGNAGGQIGAAYRGSLSGMNGGTILVGGTAGLEVAMRMKRGVIVIGRKARDFAGLQMKGGTLFLLDGAEIRTGAWMNRGTIVSLKPLPLMPTFIPACTYTPTFLRLYAKHLATLGIAIPVDPAAGSYQRYAGDTATPGKGEILVWQPRAG